MNAPDVPILIVDKALTATELRRLEAELQAAADAGAIAVLVAVDRFELTDAAALAGLVDLLEHPPAGPRVFVLLTGRIPRELAGRLLALDLQAFATPRAEVETAVAARTITGMELSLTGLAELVRSPRHAAERLRAMATTFSAP